MHTNVYNYESGQNEEKTHNACTHAKIKGRGVKNDDPTNDAQCILYIIQ